MVKRLSYILIIGLGLSCSTREQESQTSTNVQPDTAIEYDSLLAQALGADDYGMSQYVLALLMANKGNQLDSAERIRIHRGHMANIKRMGATGDLVLAGPFLNSEAYRGIYIFNVRTIEEAEALVKTDPAVQAGVFIFEMHPWYASAGLKQVRSIGKRLKKPKP